MQFKKLVAPVAVVAAAGALIVAPSTVGATTFRHYVGYAGGTAIKAVGSTVESDLTSASSVDTIVPGAGNTANTLANLTVPNLATIGAVTTTASTVTNEDGSVSVITGARTAGINLLGGKIVANAVTTTNIATVFPDGTVSHNIHTEFVGLKIGNSKIPVNIKDNFNINIPGVAQVVLNASFASPAGQNVQNDGVIMTQGAGLYLSLLKSRGSSPLGTVVYLNPTYDAIATVEQSSGPSIFGNAFGSKVFAQVGNLLNVYSGPTAQITCPIDGTNGAVKYNTTATASLPQVLLLNTITNSAQGVKAPTGQKSYVEMNTELAHLNLLGGAITADAIQGRARAETTGVNNDGATSSTFTSLVNLSIGGKSIPVNVAANTVINLGSLAKIIIRQETKSSFTDASGHQEAHASVYALHIFLLQPYASMPAGAEIVIGFAQADIVV